MEEICNKDECGQGTFIKFLMKDGTLKKDGTRMKDGTILYGIVTNVVHSGGLYFCNFKVLLIENDKQLDGENEIRYDIGATLSVLMPNKRLTIISEDNLMYMTLVGLSRPNTNVPDPTSIPFVVPIGNGADPQHPNLNGGSTKGGRRKRTIKRKPRKSRRKSRRM